ncbi:MAG: hypothetical protein EZS28_026084 [Streblomastix strix]|uniref:Uncharacterized protein n=1 Tax=Streblomastix strix TaxID=222440 RepID=A0A5J4V7L9_9EUKA|nr:MAG: hypothetical protein EZS28_026084 [Streblomastix strix]
MTQGRRIIQQIIFPKEMPFTNAIRILQLSAYPSGGVYVKQPTDVIIHDVKGNRQIAVTRQMDINADPQLEPVYQPDNEDEESLKYEINKQDSEQRRLKRIKRRKFMKKKYSNLNINEYSQGIEPHTSIWELWGDHQDTVGETNISIKEKERLKLLKQVAEWDGTSIGIGSGGAMLQTSIHMSVAHAGGYNRLDKSQKEINQFFQYKKDELSQIQSEESQNI